MTTAQPLKILIVNDYTILRQGVAALLALETDLLVIGEASTGRGVIEQVKHLKPDILLLDISLPDITGLSVLKTVREIAPQTRVIILSMYTDELHMLEALRGGASGYVSKDTSHEELVWAIRTVASGPRYLGQSVSEYAIKNYLREGQVSDRSPDAGLTRREREVIRLAAQSMTASAIAVHLGISARTVETHRSRALKKLGLYTQSELFQYALQNGWLSKHIEEDK